MAAEKPLSKGAAVKEPGSSSKNKTGCWRTFRPIVTDRCIGCGICVSFCPEGAITIKEVKGKKRAVVDYDYCKGCLICMEVCPQKAIEKQAEK
jgi:pyruvate ferredoxin oxidoreductase delta subunit